MPTDTLQSKGRVDFGVRNLGSGYTGTKNVSVAGTAEKLSATSKPIPHGYTLVIKARSDNVNKVFLAFSQSDAQTHANSFELTSGENVSLQVRDIDLIWLDAASAGDGVTFVVEKES